ncbi:MAG: hypothetical protein R6X02_27615 [Enhygromyxa sp.]
MLIGALIGAVAALIVGSMAGGDTLGKVVRHWRRALRRQVDDPGAREAGEAKLDELEGEFAELVAGLRAWVAAFAELHRRYESVPADYDRLTAALVDDFYAAQVRLLAVTDELREAIGDPAYLAITDDVEAQLRKLRDRQRRRDPSVKNTSRG